MRWLLLMAFRESRRERLGLLALFLTFFWTLAIVTALVGFSRSVLSSIHTQEKTLLGADFVLKSLRHPSPEALQFIRQLPGLEAELVQTNTMIRLGQELRLVQLRGVTERFPVYGSIVTDPPRENAGAYLDETLLVGFKLGDEIKLGHVSLPVRGVLREVPGEIGGFGLIAPRVYVPLDVLRRSGLIDFGSQVRFRFYFRGEARGMLKRISGELKKFQLEFESSEDREANIERISQRIAAFLELGALFAFLLGAVGTSLAFQAYFLSKKKSLTILRAVGCRRTNALGIFCLQSGVIAMVGALAGMFLGTLSLGVLSEVFAPILPLRGIALSGKFLGALGGGTLLLVLVSQWVMSREAQGKFPVLRAVAPTLGTVLFALPFVENLRLFLLGGAGFLLFLGFLSLATWGMSKGAGYLILRPRFSYSVRFGVLQVQRRIREHFLFLTTLSTSLVVALVSLQFRESLVAELRLLLSGEKPNIFLFDIQQDQLEQTKLILGEEQVAGSGVVPVITMRLSKIKGVDTRELVGTDRPQWVLRREYRTTYRESLLPSESIQAGNWVGRADPAQRAPLSLESSIARDLGVTIGDELTFDIQGVDVTGVVASIREVNWRSGDVNFFILFPRGVLEDAPQYYALLGRIRDDAQLARVQNRLQSLFPNIAVMDLRALFANIEKFLHLIGQIANVYGRALLGLSVVLCLVSLLGSLFRRRNDEVALSVLGAGATFRRQARFFEFGFLSFLGVATGLCGSSLIVLILLARTLQLPIPLPIGEISAVVTLFLLLPIIAAETLCQIGVQKLNLSGKGRSVSVVASNAGHALQASERRN